MIEEPIKIKYYKQNKPDYLRTFKRDLKIRFIRVYNSYYNYYEDNKIR